MSAHTTELVHIAVTVVPHALGKDTGALRQAETGGHLGLHVGGEAGIGQGFDVGAGEFAGAPDQDSIVHLLHLGAHFRDLRGNALQVLGYDVFDEKFPAGGGDGGHVGARLDLVWDDGIAAAGEAGNATDLDDVGPCAHDGGTHGVQKVGQVHDVGFLGGVLNDGGALGQSARQHQIHGGAHRDDVHVDGGAHEMAAARHGVDDAAVHVHVRAHGGEALDVLVNGPPPAAEITAAGGGNLGGAEAAQQGADEIIGGADLPGQGVGDPGVADVGAVDLHSGAVDGFDISAQLLENVEDQRHVADLGDVFNAADTVDQKSGGENGHRRVFRAGDLHCAVKRFPAMDHIFRQSCTLDPSPAGQTVRRLLSGRKTSEAGRFYCALFLRTYTQRYIVIIALSDLKSKDDFLKFQGNRGEGPKRAFTGESVCFRGKSSRWRNDFCCDILLLSKFHTVGWFV